jgi:peptide-methionine (S)-S-oxide reductase
MIKPFAAIALALFLAACSAPTPPATTAPAVAKPSESVPFVPSENPPIPDSRGGPVFEAARPKGDSMPTPKTEVATFAAGCYWCVEAVFQRIDGVVSVRSGFTGGHVENPTYEQCCTGETGHAEAVEITFDPKRVSYETLLDWFWRLHDPTSLNRQGADEGTQYRSAIFWHSEAQRAAAEKSKGDAQGAFAQPIVTEITKAGPFYPAAAYHQDYYNRNSAQGYCRLVIAPKLHKLGLDEKR